MGKGKGARYGLRIPPANRSRLPPPEVELSLYDANDRAALITVRGPTPVVGQPVTLQTAASGPLECVVVEVVKLDDAGRRWGVGVRLARPVTPPALPPPVSGSAARLAELRAQAPMVVPDMPVGQMTPERIAALKAQLARLTPLVQAAISRD